MRLTSGNFEEINENHLLYAENAFFSSKNLRRNFTSFGSSKGGSAEDVCYHRTGLRKKWTEDLREVSALWWELSGTDNGANYVQILQNSGSKTENLVQSLTRKVQSSNWDKSETPEWAQLLQMSKATQKLSICNLSSLFFRLFSEYPRYKLIWPQFRAIPDSSLMNAVELRRHASVYLKGLGKIIESMRDEEELGKSMSRIAQAHIKWNVQRNHVIVSDYW